MPIATTMPQPVGQALMRMVVLAQELVGRVQAALRHNDVTWLPKPYAANPHTAQTRIDRTFGWIIGLSRAMVGDRFYLRRAPARLLPALPSLPALSNARRAELGLPPNPPRTEHQRDAARLNYMRRIFATQPICQIAERLARRLALHPGADAWPEHLLTLTQTPAAYGADQRALPDPAPTAPTPPDVAPTPTPLAPNLAAPPATPSFYRRE